MTPSLIRCLLAVTALSRSCEDVVSKEVADLLEIKKSTVHQALSILQTKGLIHKEPYGHVKLTENGLRLGRKLERERDGLALLFSGQYGLSLAESAKASVLLMGELTEESIHRLQGQMSVDLCNG